tara:strand:+ start:232 stop:1341 length:1110 start_codon:yes stop_codon:yes gene_type:complete
LKKLKLKEKIYVTKPFVPPIEEYTVALKEIWGSQQLSNNSTFLHKLEEDLSNFLKTPNFLAVSNGTIALQMAIKALDLNGEIIVPAFTWIATLSAIKWEKCMPIFCDIDEETLNIDTSKIEELITEKTVAIMPVHVFGNPCDVESINKMAKKHDLKVIYDGAHALGTSINKESILNYGDISIVSTHATKLFNTAEGGACVTKNKDLFHKLKCIRTFGYYEKAASSSDIEIDGLNGKMSEINAALGVVNFKYLKDILDDRKTKYKLYSELLSKNQSIHFQKISSGSNFSYFPIILASEKKALYILEVLSKSDIYPRRYFYPSVNTFKNIVEYQPCPISEDISKRIICLPLYYDLDNEIIIKICEILDNIL